MFTDLHVMGGNSMVNTIKKQYKNSYFSMPRITNARENGTSLPMKYTEWRIATLSQEMEVDTFIKTNGM